MFIINVFDQEDRIIHTCELDKKYDFVSGLIKLYNGSPWVKCYTIVDKDSGLQIADFDKYCEDRGLKAKDKNAWSTVSFHETLEERKFDESGNEISTSKPIDEANIFNGWMEIHSEESGLKVTTPVDGDKVAHDYIVEVEKANRTGLTTIQFQNGPIPQVGVNGLTNEALLAILLHRTKVLNKLFPCKENEEAILHMQQAFQWFNQRTINRKARGVEGTYQK